MSTYMTEEETLEEIKKWWQRHGTKLLLALSVIMLSVAAYRYWNWHVEKKTVQASNTYELMVNAYAHNDQKKVKAYANKLMQSDKHSAYSDAAGLTLAKMYIDEKNLGKADEALSKVIQNSKKPTFKQLAMMRKARILLAKGNDAAALKILNDNQSSTYSLMIDELRGDIYAKLGQYQNAVAAYTKAMEETGSLQNSHLYLEMKLNETAALADRHGSQLKPSAATA